MLIFFLSRFSEILMKQMHKTDTSLWEVSPCNLINDSQQLKKRESQHGQIERKPT